MFLSRPSNPNYHYLMENIGNLIKLFIKLRLSINMCDVDLSALIKTQLAFQSVYLKAMKVQ